MSFLQVSKAAGVLLLAFMVQISFAQDRVITGKVTDSKDGSAVRGASVVAKGSNAGTQTNADGLFKLSVSSLLLINIVNIVVNSEPTLPSPII